MADRAYFIARLEKNLARAEADFARVEQRVFAARERGVDTSRVTPPSASSPDLALAKAAGRVIQARIDLDKYLAKGK